MDINIQIENNILSLNGKKIKFSHNIRQFKTIGDDILVLLDIPSDDDTLDNIYCYFSNGIIKWQVQPLKDAFPDLKKVFPFEQMNVTDGEISATDFYGRRFVIDSKNGKILSKDIVK